MSKLIEFFVHRPKVVNLTVIFLLLAGFLSMLRTQNAGYPSVDFGVVNITTIYPGASPADVEQKVTAKIEDQLKGISGIKTINSASLENLSQVSILMEDRADYDQVISDIQKAVDQIDDFPAGVQNRPIVEEVDNDRIPVIEVAIVGEADYSQKWRYAQALEKKLQANTLIGTIDKIGYRKQEIRIEADQEKLRNRYVSLGHIINAIQHHNVRLPSGDLEAPGAEKKLVVDSEFNAADEVSDVVIRSGFEGNQVRISDVAVVKDGFAQPDKIIRFNGAESINLLIQKKAHSDIIATAKAINAILEDFRATLPANIRAEKIVDYSYEATSLLDMVKSNAVMGLTLVLITLFLFLNMRVAFWTAMGIPLSILSAFIFFPLFGITINFISLIGILIVLGMLVDDAIVVAENIYSYREKGYPPKEAAILGAKEVMWPVVATVSTTVVAFSPLIFMTGVMGKFMYAMPIVISLMLILSLLESLFILPSHMAHAKFKRSKAKFSLFHKIENGYKRSVKFALRFKTLTLLTFILMFVFSIVLLVTRMDFILFDSSDGLYGTVEFETERGTSLEETARRAQAIEKILLDLPKEEVSTFVTTVGERKPLITAIGVQVNHGGVGNILLHFTPMGSRERTAKDIMADVKERIKDVQGFIRLESEVVQDGPPVGKPITVTVISNDDAARKKLVTDMEAFLKEQPGVSNLQNNEGQGKEQLRVQLNYNLLARLGLTPLDVATTIRTAFDGTVATTIRRLGEEVDFRVTLADQHKTSLDIFKTLTVQNNAGKLIPVGQVANITRLEDPLMINHYDGDRAVTIYGDIDTVQNTSLKVNAALKEKFQPVIDSYPDMRLEFGGEEKDTQEAMQSLFIAMILALIGIYFILVILFNSFTQPFLVMSCIPFTFTGVVFAFYLHNLVFGFVALLGLIGLMGVVVNNSLIMISFMNTVRDEKGVTIDSLADASTERLRPVLLTTLTTVAGLFPTAYGFGGDNAFLVPMIMAIAWGLVFASLITLYLVPGLYLMQYRYKIWLKNLRRAFVLRTNGRTPSPKKQPRTKDSLQLGEA